MPSRIPRWGLAALAVVVIGAPTVFYAAKFTPFRRQQRGAPRTAINAPQVNAPAPNPTALLRKGITDRHTKCASAKSAEEKKACYTRERQACDQESNEKTWCVQRAVVGKLSTTVATCPQASSATERRRCLGRLWGADALDDRKALTAEDRQEVCGGLTAQRDRDRCFVVAVRQILRDGGADRSLCAKIQDEGTRSDCQAMQEDE